MLLAHGEGGSEVNPIGFSALWSVILAVVGAARLSILCQ